VPLLKSAQPSRVGEQLPTKKVYAHYTVSRLREAFNIYSQTVDELAAEVAEVG
jgi:hypothetical protein